MQNSKAVRILVLALLFGGLMAFATKSGALQAVMDMLTGHNIPVAGAPVKATHAKLSEHEIEYIESLPPQPQAEQLLQAAINHDDGATKMIMAKVDGWRGNIERTKTWETLDQTALYSNDLRVRAAMMEADLASYKIEKTTEWADRLIESGQQTPSNRPFDAWVLGMLANRGVESQRIYDQLKEWLRDPDEQTRFWAVEGLAHIGTNETIPDFLEVLRSDASQNVRERAGCSLAKSGMLTREQRMRAIPGLIEIAGDASENSVTKTWAFQALREIADEQIGNDVAAWKDWYDRHGNERSERFRREDQNQVLGNS